MKKPITVQEIQNYITSRVEIDPETNCWIWPLMRRKNYGVVDCETRAFKFCKTESVHRISYMVFNGELEESKVVRHRCNNRPCCNPEHLASGSIAENNQDRTEPLNEMSTSALIVLRRKLVEKLVEVQEQINSIDQLLNDETRGT